MKRDWEGEMPGNEMVDGEWKRRARKGREE